MKLPKRAQRKDWFPDSSCKNNPLQTFLHVGWRTLHPFLAWTA